MHEVSVVVVTYNPDYSKLFQTLYSIIVQKDVDFEIIVSDDGSKSFDKEKVEGWFKENKFTKYTIVDNKENKGTVCNAFSGYSAATGKYIKQLSPGDYLHNDKVLAQMLSYMKEKDVRLCFGKVQAYAVEENSEKIIFRTYNAPADLNPYIQEDKKKIQENYLIKRDYVCGMAFLGERDLLVHYLSKLVNQVKYAEDCMYIYIIAADVDVAFWENYVIWYEVGTGISTSGSDIWSKRIYDDNKKCFELIKDELPKWKVAYDLNFSNGILGIAYKVVRKINRLKRRNVVDFKPDVVESDEKILREILRSN